MKLFLVSALVIFSLVQAEYPANLPKCKPHDDDCAKKAITEIISKHSDGYSAINLPSIDPLQVKSIVLERNPSSPVNVEIKFSDVDILGLKGMKVKSFEGLGDFGSRVTLEATVPNLQLVGNYAIDGHVLILPISGNGPVKVVVKNVHFKYSYDLKPVEKNGHTYSTLEHVKLELKPEHVSFFFGNLFNGDKALGDSMNKFLNDNWDTVFTEMNDISSKAISLVIKQKVNHFFMNNAIDEIYL